MLFPKIASVSENRGRGLSVPLTLDDRKSGMAVRRRCMDNATFSLPLALAVFTAADRPHYLAGDFIFCGLTHLSVIYVFVLFLSLQFNYLFAYIVGNDNINQKTSVFPYFFSEFSKTGNRVYVCN